MICQRPDLTHVSGPGATALLLISGHTQSTTLMLFAILVPRGPNSYLPAPSSGRQHPLFLLGQAGFPTWLWEVSWAKSTCSFPPEAQLWNLPFPSVQSKVPESWLVEPQCPTAPLAFMFYGLVKAIPNLSSRLLQNLLPDATCFPCTGVETY